MSVFRHNSGGPRKLLFDAYMHDVRWIGLGQGSHLWHIVGPLLAIIMTMANGLHNKPRFHAVCMRWQGLRSDTGWVCYTTANVTHYGIWHNKHQWTTYSGIGTHKPHPIACLWGQAMGCWLWAFYRLFLTIFLISQPHTAQSLKKSCGCRCSRIQDNIRVFGMVLKAWYKHKCIYSTLPMDIKGSDHSPQ